MSFMTPVNFLEVYRDCFTLKLYILLLVYCFSRGCCFCFLFSTTDTTENLMSIVEPFHRKKKTHTPAHRHKLCMPFSDVCEPPKPPKI